MHGRCHRTCGLALVETMVGLAIGLAVILTAATAFHAAHRAQRTLADRVLLEERGERALAVIAGLIRQSGWPPELADPALPALVAQDDCGQPRLDVALACGRSGIAASDALLVRFGGAGRADDATRADGTVTDCSGFPVAAQQADAPPGAGHVAANLLYVAAATDGEPQLLCRYPSRRDGQINNQTWTSGALVRGMESLQFRFGIDNDGDERVDAFVRAADLHAQGAPAWRRVRVVQVALRLRGERHVRAWATDASAPVVPAASSNNAVADLPAVPDATRHVMRQVFATTVRLRNLPCGETLC